MLALSAAIGCGTAAAQSGQGQSPGPDGVGRWLAAARDASLDERFADALRSARDGVAAELWRAAREVGPAGSAALWRLLGATTNDEATLQILTAIVACGGTAEDERLARWAEASGRSARERAFAAFLTAVGPRRDSACPEWLVGARGASAFHAIAHLCAASRYAAATDAAEFDAGQDPGLAGAAAFAAVPLRQRGGQSLRGDRHEALYWRGALLGATRREWNATIRERALALRAMPGDGNASLRAVAWWAAALAGDASPADARPDADCLAALAGDAAVRARFAEWFDGVIGPRDERPERIAVAHALTQPLARVLARDAAWATAPDVAPQVVVAVAARLATSTGERPALPSERAWSPAHVAVGRPCDDAAMAAATDDARLRAAMRARAEGRLDAAGYARALLDRLWRWGSHPDLAGWRLEREFVRDVLLAGSQAGGGRFQPHVPPALRYLPEGMGRSDPWFRVAVAAYEELDPSTWPAPAGALAPR
jgi:hypothetical protein